MTTCRARLALAIVIQALAGGVLTSGYPCAAVGVALFGLALALHGAKKLHPTS